MKAGTDNFLFTFISWWYGEAFRRLLLFLKTGLFWIADLFSVEASLKTLFAPWKRDQMSGQGLSLQDQFQVLILNLSSRFIGMMVKLIMLSVFCLVELVALCLAVIAAVFWLIWPMLGFYLITLG